MTINKEELRYVQSLLRERDEVIKQLEADNAGLVGVQERIAQWIDAYPLDCFPEPDFTKAHELLQAGGMNLDAISASNMRHVLDGVTKILSESLAKHGGKQ